jgi:hypothetical protein
MLLRCRTDGDETLLEGICIDLRALTHYLDDDGRIDMMSVSWGVITKVPEITALFEVLHFKHGVTIVGPGGNCDGGVDYPPCPYACWPVWEAFVIGAAACDSLGDTVSFSNWGPHVDFMAPGQMILSTGGREDIPPTRYGGDFSTPDDSLMMNGYEFGSGTSYSSPQVAALLALLNFAWLENHEYSTRPPHVSSLYEIMLKTALRKYGSGWDPKCGWGIINPDAATAAVMSGMICDTVAGDVNTDCFVNRADIDYLVSFLFQGGPPPPVPNLADLDSDCVINVSDLTYLVAYIFQSGPAPQMGCVNPTGSMASSEPPEIFLHQNYPNPFNPVTTIGFSLPAPGEYTLTIYNILGQAIEEFAGHAEAGVQEISWDASSHASGIYFYKLEAGDFTETRKMVLLK